MLNQNLRTGRFTSSQIWRLMTKGRGGKPSKIASTYINDVRTEKLLGRPLNANQSSRPTSWGKALEPRVAGMIDNLIWKYQSDETIIHSEIDEWCGTPDLVSVEAVGDIKCPYTLKGFAELAGICNLKSLGDLKEQYPEYYWQLVSNAVLTGKHKADLFVYCPYHSELEEIAAGISQIDDYDLQTESQWIAFSSDEKLPWIPDNGHFQNLNHFQFEIDKEDEQQLIDTVKFAVKKLKD